MAPTLRELDILLFDLEELDLVLLRNWSKALMPPFPSCDLVILRCGKADNLEREGGDMSSGPTLFASRGPRPRALGFKSSSMESPIKLLPVVAVAVGAFRRTLVELLPTVEEDVSVVAGCFSPALPVPVLLFAADTAFAIREDPVRFRAPLLRLRLRPLPRSPFFLVEVLPRSSAEEADALAGNSMESPADLDRDGGARRGVR
jgi:hypothetical protein